MKSFARTTMLFFASTVATSVVHAADMGTLLPNAKPGECYARVMIPATYRNETSTLVVREASERLSIVPAQYSWENEQVLIKDATVDLKVVPATYRTVTEQIELSPAQTKWVTGSLYSSVEASPGVLSVAESSGVPLHSAPAGQCYTELFEQPVYENVTERVVVSEATQSIKVVPAKYEWVERQQVVAAASQKLVEIPAVFKSVKENIKVEDAKVVWKKGRGAVEKIDNASGDIMCLVEVPAVYKTIEKTVMAAPPSSKLVKTPAKYEAVRMRKLVEPARRVITEVPAKYRSVTKTKLVTAGKHAWRKLSSSSPEGARRTGNFICKREFPAKTTTISKAVVATPSSVEEIEIPAVYTTKRVRTLLSKASEARVSIPAVTRQVSKRVMVEDASFAWRPVLCETNTTEHTIRRLQQALINAGFELGEIDGVLSAPTNRAIEQFQRSEGMATGGLTIEVLERLGISPG